MSHMVTVKVGHKRVMQINASGDLSALYEKLKGAHDRGTNGEGRSEVTFSELEKIVSELPSDPESLQGIHVAQRCLKDMLDTNRGTKKFIFHLS